MNSRSNLLMARLLFCVTGGLGPAPLGFGADQPAASQKIARGLEVLVTADAIASPEGFRPKPGKPVHYIFSQTRQTLGDAIAGVKLPDPALVERAVVSELEKQGFVRTAVGGPMPAIYILAIVGDSNFEEPPIDWDAPLEDPDFSRYLRMVPHRSLLQRTLLHSYALLTLEQIFNRSARGEELDRARGVIIDEAMRIRTRESGRFHDRGKVVALVGGDKVARAIDAREISNSEAQRIAYAAKENRLYVSLNAFDAARWAKKEKVLLWRTNLSIDWRKNLATELPTMLAHAGPLFGTDLAVPAFMDERSRKKAEVTIGDTKVVPDENPPRQPEAGK